jgi:hypothetical protein
MLLEFHVKRNPLITGLIGCGAAVVFGCLLWLIAANLPPSLDILGLLAIFIIGFAIIWAIVLGFFVLVSHDQISLMWGVESIVVNDQGIFLKKKDGSSESGLLWRTVKSTEYRGVRHLFLGKFETSREVVAIKFNLLGGSSFTLPLDDALKEKDRYRVVQVVKFYISTGSGWQ